MPRGYDEVDGTKRENGVETPLPDQARIGLAETVYLEFSVVRTMTLLLIARYVFLIAARRRGRRAGVAVENRAELIRHMPTLSTIAAAGATDTGRQREVNEDRFHVDEARGLFIVIDGVGGQAAGGKAADVALCMLRERLERETGPVRERVREAIAVANNEIHRLASTRPEWDGMACVLTVAVVKDGTATIGHVGDTRLYKLRDGHIEKITRDHSPVGEREDAHELSELDAMRHPRRNEVYRDVGSEPHAPDDPEFVDLHEIRFDSGDALLICSDGLTDLVDSSAILRVVGRACRQSARRRPRR